MAERRCLVRESGGKSPPMFAIASRSTLQLRFDSCLRVMSSSHSITHVATLEASEERLWSVRWSPTQASFAAAGADMAVRIFSSPNESNSSWHMDVELSSAADRSVRSVAWHPAGNLLATAAFDSTVNVWELDEDTREWLPLASLEGHDTEVKDVCWSPDGALMASCGRDKAIWLWEGEAEYDFECVAVLHGHGGDVKHLCWTSCTELISCSYDDTLRVWQDPAEDGTWAEAACLTGHTNTVWCVAARACGNWLASCSQDGSIRLWKRQADGSWACAAQRSSAHEHCVYSVAWHPGSDGPLALLSAGADNALRLWQVSDEGMQLAAEVHTAHELDVNSVDWCAANPAWAATASDDGQVKVWQLPALS